MASVFFLRRLFIGVFLVAISGPFLGWWVMLIVIVTVFMLSLSTTLRVIVVIALAVWIGCSFSRVPSMSVASLASPSSASWKRVSWTGRPIIFFRDEKYWLWNRLRSRFPKPEAELLAGLLYGDASTEARAAWKAVGVIHLLAVSGANIVFYVEGMNGLYRWLKWSRRQRFVCATAFLIFFLFFAGIAPSLVRASLFLWVMEFSRERGRVPHTGHLFLCIFTAHLVFVPQALIFSLGFVLSYLAFLTLLVVNGYTERPLARIMLTQVGCFFVSAPVLLWLQGSVAWTGIFLGPTLGLLLPLGTSLGVASLAPGIGGMAWPSFFLLRAALFLMEYAAKWNIPSIHAVTPLVAVILFEGAYIIGAVFLIHRRRVSVSSRVDVGVPDMPNKTVFIVTR